MENFQNDLVEALSKTMDDFTVLRAEVNATNARMNQTNQKFVDTKSDLATFLSDSKQQLSQRLIITKTELIRRMAEMETNLRQTKKHLGILQSIVFTASSCTFVNSGSFRNKVYLLSEKTQVNFGVFDETCRAVGGYLVRVDDKEEFDALVNFLKGNKEVNNEFIMLSGTDAGHEGHWTYFGSDLPLTYTNWGIHEPNNGNAWNCLELYTGDWTMKDYRCQDDAKYRFICEID